MTINLTKGEGVLENMRFGAFCRYMTNHMYQRDWRRWVDCDISISNWEADYELD